MLTRHPPMATGFFIWRSNEKTATAFTVEPPNTDTVRILIEAGADVNAVSDSGVSLLQQAIRDELSDVVKVLVDAGAR